MAKRCGEFLKVLQQLTTDAQLPASRSHNHAHDARHPPSVLSHADLVIDKTEPDRSDSSTAHVARRPVNDDERAEFLRFQERPINQDELAEIGS
jgi:hypothetical protein